MRQLSNLEQHLVLMGLFGLQRRDNENREAGQVAYDDEARALIDNMAAELDAGRGLALLP